MKVYRVETREGQYGPFYEAVRGVDTGMPTPHNDFGIPLSFVLRKEHFFGCGSKRKMNEWITDAKHLKEHGYVVSEYDVPRQNIIRGEHQIIFTRKGAKVVKKYDIVEFKKGKTNAFKSNHP